MNDTEETEQKKSWNYKQWYATHAPELSEKRRKRYQEDQEYRQKVLERNRAYREKKALENGDAPRPKVRMPRHRKPTMMQINVGGSVVLKQVFHVGSLARSLQRSVTTIHQWERSGLLPKTPYVSSGGSKQERLYTEEMIQVVKESLEKRGGRITSSDGMYQEIESGWKSIGVVLNG